MKLKPCQVVKADEGVSTCYDCGYNEVQIKAGTKLQYSGRYGDGLPNGNKGGSLYHKFLFVERFFCPSCQVLIKNICIPCERPFYQLETVKEKVEYN